MANKHEANAMFSRQMHNAIYHNLNLAIPDRLTYLPGREPQDTDDISMERGMCIDRLAMAILKYWEGRATIDRVRQEVAQSWAGKIDEVIQLSTPTPFLKAVQVIIKMPKVPKNGYVASVMPPYSQTKRIMRIAKHLWLADSMALNLFEPLCWRCGPEIAPNEMVAVLINGPKSQRVAIYKWTGQCHIWRRTWQVEAFLKRTRWTPPPWFTAEIA